MKKILVFLLFLIVGFSSTAQQKGNDCSRLKHSRLHFLNSEYVESYVIIDNNQHTEYFDNEGRFIKSELIWVNDCEYNAKIIEINIPDVPFKIGDVLNVKITNILNNFVDMTCVYRGETLKVQYEIIEYL